MKALFLVLGCSVLVAGSLIECDSTPTCTGAACVDANNVPGVSGGGCDSSKPAAQGGCAVDDTDGFFVSPAGSDTAAGTKIAPFQTIGKGITAAAAAALKPNVYVCAGTFSENLVVQSAPAGVALHGGFECAGWTQVNANTIVAPKWIANATAPQYVLHVLGAAALVEGITLTAPDAMDPGASSVAVLVDGSPGMTFRRATVTAGKGMDGVTPTTPADLSANTAGNNEVSNVRGEAQVCSCASDKTIGGNGGGSSLDGGVQTLPSAGSPTIAGADAGQPGAAAGAPACNGGGGANGNNGSTGNSTGTLGELTVSAGWSASPGGAGGSGGTAQGGGGGYYNLGNGVGGGGGGCGGCGGLGGGGGSGGGASIAVAAISSTLRVQSSTVRAAKAGNGANGAAGQTGQPGGGGGTGNPCNGGAGGGGGAGGAGGGGAGGVSVAIATANSPPDIDSQSTVLAGGAGVGGHDGTAAALKAIDGIADPVHAF